MNIILRLLGLLLSSAKLAPKAIKFALDVPFALIGKVMQAVGLYISTYFMKFAIDWLRKLNPDSELLAKASTVMNKVMDAENYVADKAIALAKPVLDAIPPAGIATAGKDTNSALKQPDLLSNLVSELMPSEASVSAQNGGNVPGPDNADPQTVASEAEDVASHAVNGIKLPALDGNDQGEAGILPLPEPANKPPARKRPCRNLNAMLAPDGVTTAGCYAPSAGDTKPVASINLPSLPADIQGSVATSPPHADQHELRP